MAGGYDGTIRIDSRIDSKGFNGGMRGITNSLKGVAAAVGLAFGTAAVVAFGKTAVDAASEMASALTGLRFMLDATGRSFEDAKGFIDDYIQDGLVPASDAITAYKNLLARGYDDTQIKSLMNIMKDSASFNRQAAFSMGEAIRKASEGLRQENSLLTDSVGITTNVAKMWDKYAASIGTTANNLTLAQKRQAEVNGFMAEGAIFAGAASTYLNTYAGRVSSLSASLYNMKVALGNAIIPILSKIIPYIKALVDWFVVLFNVAARVIGLFFNVDASMASAEAGAGGVADETQAAADAAGELAANTKKAGKEAKGSLAAFDQLNVLQQDTGSGAGAGTGTGAGSGLGLGDPKTIVPDELAARVEAFKTRLMELLQPATAAFGRLREALSGLGSTIWGGLKWAWDNILVPLGKWVITNALPVFLDLLASGARLLDAALQALGPLGQWLWKEFLQPLATWTGGAILDILKWLTDRLNDLGEWIKNNQATFRTIVAIIGAIAAGFAIASGVIAAFNAVLGIAGVAMAVMTGPIGAVIAIIAVLIVIIGALIANWPKISAAAQAAWKWIQQAWKDAGPWFKRNVTDPVVNWFTTAWANIQKWAGDAWKGIQGIWNGAGAWFKTNITDPIQAGFETTFNGIRDFVKGIINSIIDFINSMTSGIASGINGVVGALNAISVTVPAWVPEYGGKSFGFNLPYASALQIPRLATGGVVPAHANMLAMIGEGSKREIVTPDDLMRQIVREELQAGSQAVTVRFEGTMGELIRVMKPHIDRENKRVGRSLITGGATA
jgi:hypothetical protein